MHFARDTLGAQDMGDTKISAAKVSAPAPIKKASAPALSKGKALKRKISGFMPGRKSVVDNKNNPTSAYSMMKRKTDSMKPPSKEEVKSYHY